MKKLFQITLSIIFLISCNNIVDDRPNVVESYLRNKISTESGNTIKLNNFQKTNGIEEENGKYVAYDQQTKDAELQGCLKTVFVDGELVREYSLSEIRERVNSTLV